MPTFTKNGSIPQPHTDGTDGWALVIQEKPVPPEGKEVVWLNWQWIVRDPQPAPVPGYVWKWNADESKWIDYPLNLPDTATLAGVEAVAQAGDVG